MIFPLKLPFSAFFCIFGQFQTPQGSLPFPLQKCQINFADSSETAAEDLPYNKLMSLQENRKYSYTFYHLYEPLPTIKTSFVEPIHRAPTTPFKPAQINTVYSHLYPDPSYQSIKSARERKLSSSSATTSTPLKSSLLKTPQNDNPITYPYKNPECGINMTGKSRFEIKGDLVTVRLEKVFNSRKGGKSGSLQLELIRMSYFYDGTSGIKPEEYSSVGTAQLGELEGGWSLTDIVRTMDKKSDDEHSYRRCYVLLLEEYDQTAFKIVDYLNFD